MVFPSAGLQPNLPQGFSGYGLTAGTSFFLENILGLIGFCQENTASVTVIHKGFPSADQHGIQFFRHAADFCNSSRCTVPQQCLIGHCIVDWTPVFRLISTGLTVFRYCSIGCRIPANAAVRIRLHKTSVRAQFPHFIRSTACPGTHKGFHGAVFLFFRRITCHLRMCQTAAFRFCQIGCGLPWLVVEGILRTVLIQGNPVYFHPVTKKNVGSPERCITHSGMYITVPARVIVRLGHREAENREVFRLRLLLFFLRCTFFGGAA